MEQSTDNSHPPAKWEYKFLVFSLNSSVMHEIREHGPFEEAEGWLNHEGSAGWEVVSLLPRMGGGEAWTIALLKRPKTDGETGAPAPS